MEEPVIVYSVQGKNYLKKNFHLAYFSNYLSQNCGFKTVLYTDNQNKKIASEIPYSEIVEYDQIILEQIPKQIWSGNKILTMSMEKRPFIHIDLDFFLFNKFFLKLIKNNSFFVFHKEPWIFRENKSECIENFVKGIAYNLNINIEPKINCYNFAIVGCLQKDSINIINNTANLVIEKIIKHKDYLNNLLLTKTVKSCLIKPMWSVITTMAFEQIIFPQLLEQKLKNKCYPILKHIQKWEDVYIASKNINISHLWFLNKKNKLIYKDIKKTVKKLILNSSFS